MVDEFTPSSAKLVQPEEIEAHAQGLIRLKNAEFNWGSSSGTDTPGFTLRIPDITFVKGKINLITGPTGGGKSSVLKVSFPDLTTWSS